MICDIKNVEKASQAAVISLKKMVLKLAEVKNIIEKVRPKNIPAEEFLLVKYQAHKGPIIDIAAKMLFDFNELASKIITHRFPIDDAQEAFRTAADRKSGAIKVVLDINI